MLLRLILSYLVILRTYLRYGKYFLFFLLLETIIVSATNEHNFPSSMPKITFLKSQ